MFEVGAVGRRDLGGAMHHALFNVIGEFYDCVIEPARWPTALERAAAIIVSGSAAIIAQDTSNDSISFRARWNIAPELEMSLQGSGERNPIIPLLKQKEIDRPFSAFGAFGENGRKRSLRHENNKAEDVAAVLLDRTSETAVALLLFRGSHRQAYGREDLAALRILSPHIRRAASAAAILQERTRKRDMLSSTLEMLADGIVLTDGSARVVFANTSALRHLDEGTALARDGDKLAAKSERCSQALHVAITQAVVAGEVRVPKTGLSVVLKGTNGRNLIAWVLPLSCGLRQSLGAPYTAQAAVFVRALDSIPAFSAELFIRHYGITPAECRLLMVLVQGMTLKDAADTLGIAPATAKSHLARLFQKTGAERQADLVRLAMGSLAPVIA